MKKIRVKDMDIATGGILVAVLNEEDASELDLHPLDRIKIIKDKKQETVIIDIAEGKKIVPVGKIGLFEEVLDSLKIKNNDEIRIVPAGKPLSLEFIKKKLDGHKLKREEIKQIVWDIVHNKLGDVEIT